MFRHSKINKIITVIFNIISRPRSFNIFSENAMVTEIFEQLLKEVALLGVKISRQFPGLQNPVLEEHAYAFMFLHVDYLKLLSQFIWVNVI